MLEKLPLLVKQELYGKDGTVGIPEFVLKQYPSRVGVYVAILKLDSHRKLIFPHLYHTFEHELLDLAYVSKETTKGRMYQLDPFEFPRIVLHDILEVLNDEAIFKKTFPMFKFKRID